MQRAILTTSTNYQLSDILLFLKSLEDVYCGVLILFSDRTFKYTPINYKIIYVRIENQQRKLNNTNNERFYWYQSFLNENPEINEILLTDIRDVIFQSDPFLAVRNDKLQVAVEDQTIMNCKFNSKWIKILYGDEYYEEIKSNFIFCSGTIIGKRESIIDLINFTIKELDKHGHRLDSGSHYSILDQGIFNYYCHSFANKISVHSNSNGKIYTMGHTNISHVTTRGFQFINNKSEPYCIVHQYDRFQWIASYLSMKYNSNKKFYFKKIYSNLKSEFKRNIKGLISNLKR